MSRRPPRRSKARRHDLGSDARVRITTGVACRPRHAHRARLRRRVAAQRGIRCARPLLPRRHRRDAPVLGPDPPGRLGCVVGRAVRRHQHRPRGDDDRRHLVRGVGRLAVGDRGGARVRDRGRRGVRARPRPAVGHLRGGPGDLRAVAQPPGGRPDPIPLVDRLRRRPRGLDHDLAACAGFPDRQPARGRCAPRAGRTGRCADPERCRRRRPRPRDRRLRPDARRRRARADHLVGAVADTPWRRGGTGSSPSGYRADSPASAACIW
ncbi:MAG: hypothetical protein HW391_1965 [Chloroflexi bacterium]|nr:hypothetical protein [Chloroflexota bacterium]